MACMEAPFLVTSGFLLQLLTFLCCKHLSVFPFFFFFLTTIASITLESKIRPPLCVALKRYQLSLDMIKLIFYQTKIKKKSNFLTWGYV